MRIEKAKAKRKCGICGKFHIKPGEKCAVVSGYLFSNNFAKKCLERLIKKL